MEPPDTVDLVSGLAVIEFTTGVRQLIRPATVATASAPVADTAAVPAGVPIGGLRRSNPIVDQPSLNHPVLYEIGPDPPFTQRFPT